MRRVAPLLGLGVLILLPTGGPAADKSLSPVGETAAEKQHRALDQVRNLEIPEQTLDLAVNQLREQTGINFLIDRAAVVATTPPLGMFPGTGINPMIPNPYAHVRVQGSFHGLPVRSAVAKLLRPHELMHVLVGDTVLITTREKAFDRQLEQTVRVHAEATPLGAVLKQLARETGANLVLDPRSSQQGQTALTVNLDEVPLETAVDVLADEAGLRAVRLSNVLYVTSETRADKLRKPPAPAAAPLGGWRVWPDANGGFRLMPPAGANGCMVGALGFGGGIAGMSGPAQPVPLTPPLPKATPPSPDKPKAPLKPAITPPAKDKPAPKGKPSAEAIRPNTASARSKRKRAVVQ
jgi:hypothetical protein